MFFASEADPLPPLGAISAQPVKPSTTISSAISFAISHIPEICRPFIKRLRDQTGGSIVRIEKKCQTIRLARGAEKIFLMARERKSDKSNFRDFRGRGGSGISECRMLDFAYG